MTDVPRGRRAARALAATLLVTGALTATACSKGGQSPQATGEPAGSEASPAAAPSQPAAPAGPVTIKLANLAIEQPAVTVAKGAKIVWSNTETNGVPHNIVSGTIQGTMAQPDGLFASAALFNPGQSFEHTFATAGTFPYYCSVHPDQMKGTVTVS